jgi:hypothetical protein
MAQNVRRTIVAVATLVGFTAVVRADVRLVVPEQSPSGPYYARLERGVIRSAGGRIAIAFYRDPSCVPPNFNLLNFFDFSNVPAIFNCPLTVHGFEVWKNGPQLDLAPVQSKLRGNGAVPVWFVSVQDFEAALPGITKAELLAMPSLVQGSASFFEETLHPSGGAEQPMLSLVAHGLVPDGRSFIFQMTEAAGLIRQIRIEFM